MPSLLDEAIKVGKDLEGAGKQLETIEAQIESAQHRLKDALAEAESQSRTIVQSAKDEAALLVKSAEQTQKQALQKLQEVEAREKAVEWVKEEDAKLKKRTQDVSQAEKECEKSKSEASAKQAFYASKLDELTEWEKALAKWDATARENGLKDSLKPLSKGEKKAK